MGIFMSILTGIINAVGTIVTGLKSLGIGLLKLVSHGFVALGQVLGNIASNLTPEELGDRAIQAKENGIKPEDFSSYEEWAQKIEKDDWGYNPEKNKDVPLDNKLAEGAGVASGVLIEKYPDLPMEKFLTVNKESADFYTPERMEKIGEVAKNDFDVFGDIVNYVTGESKDAGVIEKATDALVEIEKEISPGITDDAAYDKVEAFFKD